MLFRNPMPNHIHELVEPDKLMELVDAVTGALGCTATVEDQHGEPAVRASLRGEFCSLVYSHLPLGDECVRCHAEVNEQAIKHGQPVRARCHMGIQFIYVPVRLDGRHLAMVAAANMAEQEPDSHVLGRIAEENDIPMEMLREKAARISIITAERMSAVERLLGVVGQQISDLCHQRYHLMRRLNQLSSLIEISQSINTAMALDELLDRILRIATSVLGTVTCALYLKESDGQLRLKTQTGLARDAWPPEFAVGEGLVGAVAQHQRPLIVSDIGRDSRVAHLEHLRRHGMNQFFGVPLMVAGETLGVLATVEAPVDHLDADREEFLMLLAHQIAIALHKETLSRQLRESYLDTIRTLAAAIDAKDSYTHGHSERVCSYAVAIAAEMELSAEEIERIENAALLHDIGKISVADAILVKPERLTNEEFAEIKNHPARGVRILESVDTLQNILDYVLYHHERYDGFGYPGGLQGEVIPLGARILCVADSFDAMTSGRPYQKARTLQQALAELWLCAGQQFDPDVVAAFERVCLSQPDLFAHGGRTRLYVEPEHHPLGQTPADGEE